MTSKSLWVTADVSPVRIRFRYIKWAMPAQFQQSVRSNDVYSSVLCIAQSRRFDGRRF